MRNPDVQGIAEGWTTRLPETVGGNAHATIRQWLIKGKFHPFWNHWVVNVSHLRDMPGLAPARKDHPDNTHEFVIFALDPGKDGNNVYDPDKLSYPLPWLKPIDCVVQFQAKSDAHAADICDVAAKVICAGKASPDSDFREFWKQTIPATAACDRHPEREMQ